MHMEKKKVRLTDYSDQILGGPGSRYTIFGPQIASPWLLHRTTGATGCFTSITLFLVSTLTCYWDYDKIQANSRCLVDIFNLDEEGKSSESWVGRLQVEGSGFDAGEILASVFRHLD